MQFLKVTRIKLPYLTCNYPYKPGELRGSASHELQRSV